MPNNDERMPGKVQLSSDAEVEAAFDQALAAGREATIAVADTIAGKTVGGTPETRGEAVAVAAVAGALETAPAEVAVESRNDSLSQSVAGVLIALEQTAVRRVAEIDADIAGVELDYVHGIQRAEELFAETRKLLLDDRNAKLAKLEARRADAERGESAISAGAEKLKS